jgi:hypothetical protein
MSSWDWIKSLQKGDDVIISQQFQDEVVGKVDEITKSGMVRVKGNLYNTDGSLRGRDKWSSTCIREATPEAVRRIENIQIVKQALTLMGRCNGKNLSVDQAKQIISILESK